MTLELPPPQGSINVDLVSRIAAVFDRIAFVNDKQRRQFERAVRRSATFEQMPQCYQQLLLEAEQVRARRPPTRKKAQ
jgi:hypothetical protein